VNLPTPAIVPQDAVRRLPRWGLWLLCIAYIVPGFVGRDPWKNADISAFGYMLDLAKGKSDWFTPTLAGLAPQTDGLLAYWLGAWAIQGLGGLLGAEMAVRVPFAGLLLLTLAATWYGTYYLARDTAAQPVAFAFGGEAHPLDYARAIADGSLLALIGCLGLAQLSHETSSYLMQLCCTSLVFLGLAAMPYRRWIPVVALGLGMPGLALAGAPSIAIALALGGLICITASYTAPHKMAWVAMLTLLGLVTGGMAWGLDLWMWRVFTEESKTWQSLAKLLLWFGWPAWPLLLWTVWRWRQHISSPLRYRHLSIPLWFLLVSLVATLTTQPADRALLLGLPVMATLAAFALPTLSRSLGALVDWFTLLFFSISALAIWVIWLAMQTGFPAKPAANVAKLAPGFVPSFSGLALLVALAGTLAWCGLVWWRTSRTRHPIWKSLVLPAAGATLSWLLLTTLWLPLLNYARSYAPQIRNVAAVLGPQPGCIVQVGLGRAQIAALQYHGGWTLQSRTTPHNCNWMLADADTWGIRKDLLPEDPAWELVASVNRPTDKDDQILVLKRKLR